MNLYETCVKERAEMEKRIAELGDKNERLRELLSDAEEQEEFRYREYKKDAERWRYALTDPLTFCRALQEGYPGETPPEVITAVIDAAMGESQNDDISAS